MRVAFVTYVDLPDGRDDDYPAAAILDAQWVSWDDPGVDWNAFDRVVVRTPWNYTARLDDFLAWCRSVGPQRLRNAPELVAFNSDKRYLAELPVATVPTRFVVPGDPPPELEGEVVVKPSVSAGARDTGRFGVAHHAAALALIEQITAGGRVALVQPYLPTVDSAGETALLYMGGVLSHVLHKRAILAPDEIAPRASDDPSAPAAVMFEDDLVVAGRADADQRAVADALIADIGARFGTPLYARVDLVRGLDGKPLLLELEAIEPCLYIATAPGAAERFAAAVLAS